MNQINFPAILLAGVLSLGSIPASVAHGVQKKCAELTYRIKEWSPPADISA
jgi:hypothetical protein